MVTLEQINDHRRTFPNFTPDTIEARAAAIEADLTALAALEPQPDPAELLASIERAEAVNSELERVKTENPGVFEAVRKLPFESQAAYFGL